MAEVVLAVAKCALTILPRFAPMNGCEGHQHNSGATARRRPRPLVEDASPFECMAVCRVVVDRGRVRQATHGAADDVRLGRMEIAARRIHPQRPTRLAEPLPGGEPERVPEHITKSGGAQRFSPLLEIEQLIVGRGPWQVAVREDRGRRVQRKDWRPVERAKWTWLRRPVEIAERPGEVLEVVLRAVVVAMDGLESDDVRVGFLRRAFLSPRTCHLRRIPQFAHHHRAHRVHRAKTLGFSRWPRWLTLN